MFVRPFGFAGRRSHSRAWSPATSNGPPFVSPMNATPGVRRKTSDTGEVDAGTAAPRRQVGVDLVDGLAVETSRVAAILRSRCCTTNFGTPGSTNSPHRNSSCSVSLLQLVEELAGLRTLDAEALNSTPLSSLVDPSRPRLRAGPGSGASRPERRRPPAPPDQRRSRRKPSGPRPKPIRTLTGARREAAPGRRLLKRRKPSTCLIQPLGASDNRLRSAYAVRPAGYLGVLQSGSSFSI